MKFHIFLGFLFATLGLSAQNNPSDQLKYIFEESKIFFKGIRTEDSLDLDSNRVYRSKVLLEGTIDNSILISKDGHSWAFYFAHINDSTSLKGAKKLANDWREIIENNIQGLVEDKTKRMTKNIMGEPLYGYVFRKNEGSSEYSILITYSKRPSGKYLIFLQLGRQY